MVVEPSAWNTVASRLAVHGSSACPGRHSHTGEVPDDPSAPAVDVVLGVDRDGPLDGDEHEANTVIDTASAKAAAGTPRRRRPAAAVVAGSPMPRSIPEIAPRHAMTSTSAR
ncbi:MAG TPA: hypothetical protein VID75_14125 [Acidimicrobiales bacterium]|jgi:hypothetical protein